jgi:predicted alpha/beta-fold hydrolase
MTSPIHTGSFRPARLWRNAHLQSILPSLPPRRWYTRRRARELLRGAGDWLIDCGAHGRLHAAVTHAAQRTPTQRVALLLHGWEGSADSTYVLSLGAELLATGYDVVRLNLRDHGGTQHLNRELFHSCRLPEVVAAVQFVAQQLPSSRLYLAGFSLGGNFMLRVAAEAGLPASVAGVAAISPVLHPEQALQAMERGWPLYHRYFVERWSRSLRIKQQAWPGEFDFGELLRLGDLRAMTVALVREHTDFADAAAYLDGYAITGTRLASLAVPARILAADDDPIIPADELTQLADSPHLIVQREHHGGHCGFMDNFSGPSYADRFVMEQFNGLG